MICEQCKKEKATVSIEEVFMGKKTEINLCQKCSLEHNMEAYNSTNAPAVLHHLLKHMLFGMDLDMEMGNSKKALKESFNKSCECGMSSTSFKKTGKLGCGKCYETFEKELLDIFNNIQRDTDHKGKFPKKNGHSMKIAQQIKALEKEQANAVASEEYEQAAVLRDRIKALKNGSEQIIEKNQEKNQIKEERGVEQ